MLLVIVKKKTSKRPDVSITIPRRFLTKSPGSEGADLDERASLKFNPLLAIGTAAFPYFFFKFKLTARQEESWAMADSKK